LFARRLSVALPETNLKKSDKLAQTVKKKRRSGGAPKAQKPILYLTKAEVESFFAAIPAGELRDCCCSI
jgi:hypothetical protein